MSTATWTRYLHDDVDGFGALSHGLPVNWSDRRDHGTAYGWELHRWQIRDGFLFVATAQQAVKLAEVLVDAGMDEVQIGGMLDHEAREVMASRFSKGYRFEWYYALETGWYYIDASAAGEGVEQ